MTTLMVPPKRVPRSVAIRHFCMDCVGGSAKEVENCTARPGTEAACPLWPIRLDARGGRKNAIIRRACTQRMGGHPYWVAECEARECALWPFRMGREIEIDAQESPQMAFWKQPALKAARGRPEAPFPPQPAGSL